MPTALLLTVGGSPEPLLTCVRELQPQRVVFFASDQTVRCVDGAGRPNERRLRDGTSEKLDNFVTLMQLQDYQAERDRVLLEDIDDVQACYQQMSAKVAELKAEGWRNIAVDYTGGTKSMSAGLLLLAVDESLDIHVTTGLRDNTRAVQRGQTTRGVGVTDLRTQRHLQRDVARSFRCFDYSEAHHLLQSLVRPRDLSRAMRHQVQFLASVAEALSAWDVFDHEKALECVDSPVFSKSTRVREKVQKPLQRLVGLRHWLLSGGKLPAQGSGYELVEDLVLNAQRRTSVRRYDDAVGRYYRALEMLAQVRLKLQYGIETGAVQPEQVPIGARERYLKAGEAETKLGLRDAYSLLRDLQDPVVGPIFADREKVLINALSVRNNSLFAHGYQPIGPEQFDQFLGFAGDFLNELLDKLYGKANRIPQLPTSLDEIWE